MTIQNFRKIRRDGRIIYESMTAQEMISTGWLPDKVIEIRWNNDFGPVSIRAKFGILAKVVSGREYVAALTESDETGLRCTLSIFNGDGECHLSLPNIQKVQGKDENGEFCWFETSRVESLNVFGVVFCRDLDNSPFQLVIDAATGCFAGVYSIR